MPRQQCQNSVSCKVSEAGFLSKASLGKNKLPVLETPMPLFQFSFGEFQIHHVVNDQFLVLCEFAKAKTLRPRGSGWGRMY